jgi:transcription antitermination factor NusG
MANWYAIWTKSRHERVVHTQLEQKGYEAFLPLVRRWSRWKDRKKQIDWPLFPGYCFVRCEPQYSLPVLTCAGVVTILTFDSQLAVVAEHEIEAIRRVVGSELRFESSPLVEGTTVQVVRGPLTGVIGRLVRKGAHARLLLSVDLIRQAVSVEVHAADVEPLPRTAS